jgi:hypothetical protein
MKATRKIKPISPTTVAQKYRMTIPVAVPAITRLSEMRGFGMSQASGAAWGPSTARRFEPRPLP